MQKQTVSIEDIQTIAENTKAFWLEKPKGFSFTPGQYFQVYVESGESHTFSIASAPHEERLLFATRIRKKSAYKQKLDALSPGDAIEIGGVGGQFVLPDDATEPIVYLVGGIGITPVRSMLLYESSQNPRRAITLLFSNRMPETAPFLDELKNSELPHYTFVATMTRMEDSDMDWSGETGYINQEMVEKYVEDTSLPVYYVVGPPGFVSAMVDMLANMGISRRDIVAEEFAGY